MTPEGRIQAEIQLALSEAGCTVFRNETAGAWVGRKVGTTSKGDIILRNARLIEFGLCKGSSDLVGWTGNGTFLAIEVKTPTGRVEPEQQNFIDNARRAGAVAGVCRSVDDALQLIARHKN